MINASPTFRAACIQANGWDRRQFVRGLAALAGAAGLSAYMRRAAAEPPPEVTKIKIHESSLSCVAAQVVAGELLYAEGFTDVRYVNYPKDIQNWPPADLLAGEVRGHGAED